MMFRNIGEGVSRALLVGFVIGLVIVGLMWWGGYSLLHSETMRIEYVQYDVKWEGYVMMRAASPLDSVATPYTYVKLPVGTIVYVPHAVPGTAPNEQFHTIGR